MYTRDLPIPSKSFFLLGPRGTGKSTWLHKHFQGGYWIDLLPPEETLKYTKEPSLLRKEILALPKDTWIILDEIQRAPLLLDEVHYLMENEGYKKFALTGSSARKIKRGTANLLAGRAIMKQMFPLNSKEIKFSISPERILTYGLLPMSITAPSDKKRMDYLLSYVLTYLNEEIKYEGLVRNVGSFARFLEIASLMAGQKINISNLARDAQIGRDTVRGYFDIFEDTLLGSWLPAYRPRAKVKEIASPKFYWFDPGVLHAAAGGFKQPMPSEWKGILLEHWIYHELKSYMNYQDRKGSLGYWSTPTESEIDFLWWYGQEFIPIEVKASSRFREDFMKGIRSFSQSKKIKSSWIVYLGEKSFKVDQTYILPVQTFLNRLHRGDIF